MTDIKTGSYERRSSLEMAGFDSTPQAGSQSSSSPVAQWPEIPAVSAVDTETKTVHFSKRVLPHMQIAPGLESQASGLSSQVQSRQRDAQAPTDMTRIWGQLFSDNGEPTEKFSALSRAISTYLIEKVHPVQSLVVTPAKLIYLYTSSDPPDGDRSDIIKFQSMFGERSSTDNWADIQTFYKQLGCEQHLVQPDPQSEPYMPALTPRGFQRWMTLLMRSDPDNQARRLNKILRIMPLESSDFSSHRQMERLPTHLPRHLLPANANMSILDFVNAVQTDWLVRQDQKDQHRLHRASGSVSRNSSIQSTAPLPITPRNSRGSLPSSNQHSRSFHQSSLASSPTSPAVHNGKDLREKENSDMQRPRRTDSMTRQRPQITVETSPRSRRNSSPPRSRHSIDDHRESSSRSASTRRRPSEPLPTASRNTMSPRGSNLHPLSAITRQDAEAGSRRSSRDAAYEGRHRGGNFVTANSEDRKERRSSIDASGNHGRSRGYSDADRYRREERSSPPRRRASELRSSWSDCARDAFGSERNSPQRESALRRQDDEDEARDRSRRTSRYA